MSEIYKGQLNNLQKMAEEMANDPLAQMKNINMDEEEKYNLMDETHRPYGILTIEFDPKRAGFCHLLGQINIRTTDGKICIAHRYLYPDGEKKWSVMKGKNENSIWITPFKKLEELRQDFFGTLMQASVLIGNPMENIHLIEFTGKENDEELKKKLLDSDLVYMAEVDPKKHTAKIINEKD